MRDGGAVLFIAEDQEYVDRILPLDRPAAGSCGASWWSTKRRCLPSRTTSSISYATMCEAGADADLAWLAGAGRQGQVPSSRRSSSIPPARPGIPRARSSRTASTSPRRARWRRSIPRSIEKPHRTVAYLPLCHVLGRDIAVTLPLITELVPHIGETREDLPETLFETAPTVLFTVPRYLQKMAPPDAGGIAGSTRPQALRLPSRHGLCPRASAAALGRARLTSSRVGHRRSGGS